MHGVALKEMQSHSGYSRRNDISNIFLSTTVKQLMYGFGDVPNPANDAVGVMEDMVIEYLTDTVSVFLPTHHVVHQATFR